MDILENMATFARVVEAGSLSAAARQLRISGAAVSRQLAALEAEIGAPLVLRTTRKLAVTEIGRQYYERCLRILREVEEAQALARAHKEARGLLAVSAPVTFGLARVAPHLPSLLAKHRGLRIDLRLEDHVVDLVSDGVDVAIRTARAFPDSDALIAHPLDTYERVLVAAPGYLERAGSPREPEALTTHALLSFLPLGGPPVPLRFTRQGKEVEVRAPAVLRSNAPYALRDAALQGAGIALLPDWFVEDAVARGELVRLLDGWHTEPVTVAALHRAELRGALRVRVLIEHLRRAYAAGAPPRSRAALT